MCWRGGRTDRQTDGEQTRVLAQSTPGVLSCGTTPLPQGSSQDPGGQRDPEGLPVIPHIYRAPGSTWAGGTAGPSWPSPPALPRDTPSLARSIPKMPTGLLPGMAAKPRPPSLPIPSPSPCAKGLDSTLLLCPPGSRPAPPRPAPGILHRSKSCKFTAFQLHPKNKRFGKYQANEWEDEKRRN